MAPFFNKPRDRFGDRDAPRPAASSRLLDLAAEFAQPASPGAWTVQTQDDPWRVIDQRNVVQLLCDKSGTVRRTDGAVLFRLMPDIAAARPSLMDGLIWGAINTALGTDPTVAPANPGGSGGRSTIMANSRVLLKDAAGVTVARIADAGDAAQIELLPAGPLNKRLIAQRLAPELIAKIRALGPLRYSITNGGSTAGTGQLSGPGGQTIAVDQFVYVPPERRAGSICSDLGSWKIQIVDSPFPASWLFALLRLAK